jgi:hypothetical protein
LFQFNVAENIGNGAYLRKRLRVVYFSSIIKLN